ncbi:plp-dependent transferase [Malassezia pachydermatis]|uniref:sphinganine-1-phosphate aldolase n=1 Tax=Malassezia pachydermatis TaxID=77020 RepID=A0A0M8MMK0_9BASI|nr:plp-dependent transferase [Malassezia pachydermatis]KOS15516.1 plp-dependent transferase [Malassezia pachydermatis]
MTVTHSKAGAPSTSGPVVRLLRLVVTFDNARTLALIAVVWHYSFRWGRTIKADGVVGVLRRFRTTLLRQLFRIMMLIPSNRRRVEREMSMAVNDVAKSLMPPTTVATVREMPAHGHDLPWVTQQLENLMLLGGHGESDGRHVYLDGHVSGAVYHGGEALNRVMVETIERFLLTNPLHPEVFPGLRKMESEVVSMVLRMYHAPEGAAGTTTSGGTESIMMACLAMREWGRHERGITQPEIVVPVSAHVAFDKAGHYFGMTVRRIPVDKKTRKVRLDLVQRAINANTVLLVGSAPNFPDGIIDDMVSIGALAKRYGIGCHVDACLGSFLVPFLEPAGFLAEPFDFRVEGVTSISCDTHKYGFAPKGSSIVMYRTEKLRRFQYFVSADWVGGVYASPTLAGSRPGALIAGAWAVMMTMGYDGYLQSCREIVGAAQTIARRVREEIPELYVLGQPLVSVVAIGSAGKLNIYDVGDQMSRRGWHLNAISGDAPAFHIACTRLTVPVVDRFIADLKESVQHSHSRPSKAGTMATVYGLHTTTPVAPILLNEMAARFIDTMYKLAP